MEWNREAEKAVGRAPFFVRRKIRKRVEEEAVRRGDRIVTPDHVEACRRRFLTDMESEVRGWRVETCFGPGGCPNRAVADDGAADRVEEVLQSAELLEFLREKVDGPLRMHHEFRVSISDCPNACSRPQIADLGFIGARRPSATAADECTACHDCVAACREGALQIKEDRPVIDAEKCLLCGKCVEACQTGALAAEEEGYRVQAGGRLGRRPQLARELPGLVAPRRAADLTAACVDWYKSNNLHGERSAEVINRRGFEDFLKAVDLGQG